MLRSLAFGFMFLLLPAIANADFVLDTFETDQPISTVSPSPTGTFVAVASRSTSPLAGIAGGTASLTSVLGTPGVINYVFTGVVNPLANDIIFRGVTSTVAGTLRATFRNNAPYNVGPKQFTSVSRNIGVLGTAQDLSINITSISNISETTEIALSFTSAGAGSVTLGSVEFASVPEPASLALAGMAVTGMGGVVVRRRRKAVAVTC